jgi:membrane-associated phospholipid phosphatase
VSRFRLTIIALVSLLTTALLGLAVSRGYGAYGLEWHAMRLLGHASNIARWADLADLLAAPVIVSLVVVSVIVGARRRIPLRVVAFAGFAGAALLINEHVVKPTVQERLLGGLSFPSGHVTAVCATALAMWIALYPVLGRWARVSTFVLGAGWTLLMSIAVVGAFWHTPLDDVGSIFLSVGVVTAGAAILGPLPARRPPMPVAPVRVLESV